MSDLRRENQEKRLVKEIFKLSENPRKPWIDGVVAVVGISSGLVGAYHFPKIELAIPFGLICLISVAFLLGEIPWVRRHMKLHTRLPLQSAFVVLAAAPAFLTRG